MKRTTKTSLLILTEFTKSLIVSMVVFLTIRSILNKLHEESVNLHIVKLIIIFLLSPLFSLICLKVRKKAYILIGLVVTLGLLYWIDYTPACLVLYALYLGLAFRLTRGMTKLKSRWVEVIFNCLIFVLISFLAFNFFLIKINFSVDEGFVLLMGLLYLIYSIFLYISLVLGQWIWKLEYAPIKSGWEKVLSILLLIILNILVLTMGYWSSLGLSAKTLATSDLNHNNIFQEIKDWSSPDFQFTKHKTLTKEDLVDYLEGMDDNKIDKYGCLYLLDGDAESGLRFKTQLLKEANDLFFLESGGSVKAWQYEVASRAYFYLRIKEYDPSLFEPNEDKLILAWFRKINEYAYKITTADYVYACLFKQKPLGFYYNQEIGFGMLALFYEMFRGSDPSLADKNYEVLKKYAVGWGNNFRNTDDGIVYHQNVWITNAYLLYRYAGIGDLNNSKLSFDWITYQTPYQSGRHPNYNSLSKNSALGSMIIGSALLKDGRYKYLAENMLEEDKKQIVYPESLIGLDLWADEILARQPEAKSYYIQGPTGLNMDLKELKPDKLVLRKIVDDNELLIIINLRSSGWHRYNGSGSIVLIKYGDQIWLEDNIINSHHNWLPKGKAQHRDKKITNQELSIYQPESKGIEKMFYGLFSFNDNLKYQNYNNFIRNIKVSSEKVEILLGNNVLLLVKLGTNLDITYHDTEDNRVVKSFSFEL